ncbi:hypothetical protein [Segniliparus rugosus]|uniref:Uncharacterized protein n=1 Tax=Segniliparus rugosus (strain ATCC BAA-974 / DSM 45345 / CCUG 50838 / CIP 108380 / JCM 13579 / CDC 945) TaxID=679197 RepID=E5XP68_SEGRC|nr:hypothetical protein [Segniliparus rugosus]EFV13850.1 hypothetical protein HMPREF9336_01289 [Segniliparus rugosus ATCC BAA-974]
MTHDELKNMADQLVAVLGSETVAPMDRAAAHTVLVSIVDQIEAGWRERINVRDELLKAAEERILSLEAELFLINQGKPAAKDE